MRSVAGKTSRELQLDLPLSESPPDPTSSLPPHTGVGSGTD
jgi:hypothetical protein